MANTHSLDIRTRICTSSKSNIEFLFISLADKSLEEIKDWQRKDFDIAQPDKSTESFYSDATLEILTSSQNPNFKIKFPRLIVNLCCSAFFSRYF